MLKGALLKARGDGIFKGLPHDLQCQLGVEEHDGRYGVAGLRSAAKRTSRNRLPGNRARSNGPAVPGGVHRPRHRPGDFGRGEAAFIKRPLSHKESNRKCAFVLIDEWH